MNNVHRSDYVEAIVAVALADYGWTRKDPWEGWDCEHTSGVPLEVKPDQKSIGLGPLRRLVSPCSFDDLGAAVERVRKSLGS